MGNIKLSKKDLLKELGTLGLIFIGNIILALGIMVFVEPMGFMTGGATGLGLLMNNMFNIPLSTGVGILNVVMFIIGFIFLGKRFAATTLISTIVYPAGLKILESMPQIATINNDPLLASVLGGALIGVGVGLVIRVGASTGGMDIPPIIINKKTGIPVAYAMNVMDLAIMATQIPYSNSQNVLYSILVIFVTTMVMNKIALIGVTQTQVMVISSKYMEINQAISEQIDRGTTLLEAVSGHLKQPQKVVMSIINNHQLHEFTKVVKAVDPHAFIIINRVNEVHGNGFTLQLDDKSLSTAQKDK